MVAEVVCPSCGRGNDRGMAESYRVCVHCGGDLGPALSQASPMDDLQRSIDGTTGPPPGQAPPPSPAPGAPPGQPAYPQPPPSHGAPPPAYGAPPPGYGAQPYGGQPYPPPQYGAGPYYGAPAAYPPTYHPGVYDRPAKAPYVDVGALFKLLFKPKEAFEDLYDHTEQAQGIILAIMFIVISGVIGIVAMYAIVGDWDLPDDASTPFTSSSAATSVIGIVTNVIGFFLVAWLFHAFSKGSARRPSLSKTIGMMGYAKFPAFLLTTIAVVALPLSLRGLDETSSPDDFLGALGQICGIMILYLVAFIWAWWVHSHAQSVANDLSTGSAMGYIFLAWFLMFIIIAIIQFAIVAAVLGSTLGF